MKRVSTICLVWALLIVAFYQYEPAFGGYLYGIEDSWKGGTEPSPAILYQIDLAYESVTEVWRISLICWTGIYGLAYNSHDGYLYGSSSEGVYRISPADGYGEVVWSSSWPWDDWEMPALTFNPSDGYLYGYYSYFGGWVGERYLYKLCPINGYLFGVAEIQEDFYGLAYNSSDGYLYGTSWDSGDDHSVLYRINPANGNMTHVSSLYEIFHGLAYNSSDGYLYGIGLSTLYRIDPANGSYTALFSIPSGICGLTYCPDSLPPRPPQTTDVNIETSNNIPVVITLKAVDDGFPDSPAALSYIITSLPEQGILTDLDGTDIVSVPYTLADNADSLMYTPVSECGVTTSFKFIANDGGMAPDGGDSNEATVSVLTANCIGGTYSGGSGIPNDPYLIAEPNDLLELRIYSGEWDKHFLMISDVNMVGYTFDTAVIAPDEDAAEWGFQGTSFNGIFDGADYKILNLTIDSTEADNDFLGLFGQIGGEVRNLGLENVSIIGGAESRNLGGLCGKNYGTISNCYASGLVTAGVDSGCLGGLCGGNEGTISNCYTTGLVTGGFGLGGLCGYNGGTISNCYSEGSVVGGDNSGSLGGLCGENWNTISNCYAIGPVTAGVDSGFLGGLCGFSIFGTIENCYATGSIAGGAESTNIGGLCGGNGGMISNCFWDTETSGMTTSDGGTGLPTEDMQKLITFTNATWDFVEESTNGTNDIWRMCEDGIHYPHLFFQYNVNGDFACPDGVGIDDLLSLGSNWLNSEELDTGFSLPCDPTFDGVTNLADYAVLAENWLGY